MTGKLSQQIDEMNLFHGQHWIRIKLHGHVKVLVPLVQTHGSTIKSGSVQMMVRHRNNP